MKLEINCVVKLAALCSEIVELMKSKIESKLKIRIEFNRSNETTLGDEITLVHFNQLISMMTNESTRVNKVHINE